jgi:hypothetical protein
VKDVVFGVDRDDAEDGIAAPMMKPQAATARSTTPWQSAYWRDAYAPAA